MRVSIIIPAHNEANYIEATLRAVLALDYPDREIIVVNNNSTDNTAAVVQQFKEVILLEQKTPGVQWARELGRQHATGELIANLDADCRPPTDWLTRAIPYFTDPKVVAVTGPYYYDDRGRWFGWWTSFSQNIGYNFAHKIGVKLFKIGAVMLGGNVIMRAEALAQIGGYNTGIAFYGDDTDTANRLLKVGKVLFETELVVRSSARRFNQLGSLQLTWRYFINYLWVVVFKKPYHQ